MEIDLSDAKFDFEYDGKVLENDVLKDFEITADKMEIKLKSIPGKK